MDKYKEASKKKLRFTTAKGNLSVEQLWDLSITDLDVLAVTLQEQYENSSSKSFLVKRSSKNRTAKLRFDIVLDVLTTKVEEQEKRQNVLETKKHNERIMQLIEEKKEEGLKGKSIEELEALIVKE